MSYDAEEARWGAFRSLLMRGPCRPTDAMRVLDVSRPTFSRLTRTWASRLLVSGRARATRYLGVREILDAGQAVPVTEIQPDGTSLRVAVLHGVLPRAFWLASAQAASEGYFEDLPYVLHEMRPAGFLGRLIPRQHPELGFPLDIGLWTADNVVAYCSRMGWDLPGNLVLGEPAWKKFLESTRADVAYVADGERMRRYPSMADDVLGTGQAGSSAAGEQPKFLVARSQNGRAALVKFSPPTTNGLAERISDLLVAEHLALESMRTYGQDAARTELLFAGGRTFLESERFDRLPGHGRRGVISLFALDAQFLGALDGWIPTTERLSVLGVVPRDAVLTVRWRQRFGELIGNTDMHAGNLMFFMQTLKVQALAPAYDMSPARYAPRQSELPELAPLAPVFPGPDDGAVWTSVCEAAEDFWRAVERHDAISPSFRTLAARNARVVRQQAELARRLPRG